MDNFDLKKYLAEGRLFEEDESQEELNFTKEIEGELYLDTDKLKNFLTSLGYREDEVDEYVRETEDAGEYEPYQSTNQEQISDDYELYLKYLAEGKLFEAQKYDIEAVLKDITEFNRGNIGMETLTISTIKNLGYYVNPDSIIQVEDHFYASMSDNERLPIDRTMVRELYDILENLM